MAAVDTEVKIYVILFFCLILAIPIAVAVDLNVRDTNAEDFTQVLIDQYDVTFDSKESMKREFLIVDDPISVLTVTKDVFLDMLHEGDTVYRDEVRFYILQLNKDEVLIGYKYVVNGLVV